MGKLIQTLKQRLGVMIKKNNTTFQLASDVVEIV